MTSLVEESQIYKIQTSPKWHMGELVVAALLQEYVLLDTRCVSTSCINSILINYKATEKSFSEIESEFTDWEFNFFIPQIFYKF